MPFALHKRGVRLPALGIAALLLIACGDDGGGPADAGPADAGRDTGPPPTPLDDSWTLTAPGITVEVTGHPYGYAVQNDGGETVLSTLGSRGEGYAPIAWTTGDIIWRRGALTKGHYGFQADLDPWRQGWVVVEAREQDAALELELVPPDGSAGRIVVRHAVRASTLRVEAELAGDATTPRAWAAAFATDGDEGFLGLGERFNETNQRGVDVYSWAEEGGIGTGEGTEAGPNNPTPNGEAMAYYPVPFFLSTSGYAFWLDSTWRNEFNFATAHDDAWRVWEIGPKTAFEIYVPIPDDERLWPYHLIDLFTETTGRPMTPPDWTFGPRRRINRTDMQMGVSEIEAMRDLDLAITALDDSMHFLPKGNHVGIEEELRAWVERGHELGYKVNCYYNSLFATGEASKIPDVVQEGIDEGYFLMGPDGEEPSEVELISGEFLTVLQVDFTEPAAFEWYQDKLDWALDLGYDGWMYDFGEYVQPKSTADNGMTGEELHNLYPVLYQKAAYEHLESTDIAGQWLTFVRSGYTGASQYSPMIWSGDPAASFEDSDGLPSMPRAGINLGVSGAPFWGGDIGGFHCSADGGAAADGELWTRWIQQGALSPNMQDQDACSFAMDDVEKASIWSSDDAMDAWRTYARLHTRLLPYHQALAQKAHQTGRPLMRHVFLEHPSRPDLASVDDAYYYGPSLFVAPVVTRGATEKTVELPEGRYLDWTGETVYAAGEVTVPAPLDKLPLFLRDGHLVPLLDPTIDTLAEESHAEVVGPTDVSDVYDVVGFVSADAGGASFTLADGGTLEVSWGGGFSAPGSLTEATTEAELADCAGGCWRTDDLGGGLMRVRITHDGSELVAGGLTVRGDVGRRVRWDLYLL